MAQKYDSIIFDFDYTLADSSKGVIDCVNYALTNLNLPAEDPQSICKTIGHSLHDTFILLAGENYEELAKEFSNYFVQRADKVMADLTTIYDYVPNMFKIIKQKGLKTAIVSTKFRYRIEGILAREKLLDYIDIIVGGEDVKSHKPDPEGLLLAIKKLSTKPKKALYIGDSLVDYETAKRCGVNFAAMISGITKREEFMDLPITKVFENGKELTDWMIE